ncbi:phosphotransferase enzyme family protein [Streptomyces sp. NPDC001273]|uniref:phosphotransferase enzyme family protein n=1 Tax=unclassified Streptomyces TaxID=2593676 RepID=UPI0033E0EC77
MGRGSDAYTADAFRRALEEACAETGLSAAGAEPLHLTVNAVFRLRHAPVVVRIAGPQLGRDDVVRVVALAHWLEREDVPAVRLAPLPVPQPVATESGLLATFWHFLPHLPGRTPAADELADPLRRVHNLGAPPCPLPDWDPLSVDRARLDRAPVGVGAAELAYLHDLADRLEDELPRLRFALPRAVIHGDAHIGNLLHDTRGHPVLCDLDFMCVGPPEWDLVPELMGCVRYGRPMAGYQRLVDAYGFDPRTWEGLPTMARVHALNVLTVVLPLLEANPGMRAEWRRRIGALRDGAPTGPWTSYRYTV